MKGNSQKDRPVSIPLEITKGTSRTKKVSHKSAIKVLAFRCAQTSHISVRKDVSAMYFLGKKTTTNVAQIKIAEMVRVASACLSGLCFT